MCALCQSFQSWQHLDYYYKRQIFNTVLMLFSDVVLIVLIVLQPLPGEIRSAKEELQKYIFS